MQSIALLLPDLKPSECSPKIKSQRQYLVSLFEEQLNKDRGDRKPLTSAFIAIKMSHLSILDLYAFLAICEKAKNFSSTWWWSLSEKALDSKYKKVYNYRRQSNISSR